MSNSEKCRLCTKNRELRRSHYIPKSLYKLVLESQQPKDRAAVLVDFHTNVSVRSNRQATRKALCQECERRFAMRESYVIKQCYRGGGRFALRDSLAVIKGRLDKRGRQFWLPEHYGGAIDTRSLGYFAVSILWRGSSIRWQRKPDRFYGALGPYEEVFRKFLLDPGTATLPAKSFLHVKIDFDVESSTFVMWPITTGRFRLPILGSVKSRTHTFMIPGMLFTLSVGGDVVDNASIPKPPIMISSWSFTKSRDFDEMARQIRRTRPTGTLRIRDV